MIKNVKILVELTIDVKEGQTVEEIIADMDYSFSHKTDDNEENIIDSEISEQF